MYSIMAWLFGSHFSVTSGEFRCILTGKRFSTPCNYFFHVINPFDLFLLYSFCSVFGSRNEFPLYSVVPFVFMLSTPTCWYYCFSSFGRIRCCLYCLILSFWVIFFRQYFWLISSNCIVKIICCFFFFSCQICILALLSAFTYSP